MNAKHRPNWYAVSICIVIALISFLGACSVLAEPYRFTLTADKTYTAQEKEQLRDTVRKINELSVDPCFQSWFTDKSKRSQLIQTNGKTREQVAKHFATATAHARVTMYYTAKNVIGYRNKGSNLIHTNSKYYRNTKSWRGKICPRVSNTFHELAHVLGYAHDFERTKRRPFSVPYSVSSAVNACCKE
jgi:hypothetical protein